MGHLQIQLLGPLQATLDGQSTTFPAPHRVQRVKLQARRSNLIDDVGELPAGKEVQRHDLHMALVVGVQPQIDGLRREAAIGEGDDERRARFQDARHLYERFHRAREILHGDGA